MPEGTIDYHAGTVFRERCSVYPNISPNIIAIGSAIHFSWKARSYLMGNREILREKDENKNFDNSLEYLK